MSKIKKIIFIIVLILIILGISIFGFLYYKTNQVATILTMDINPSISISLNYKNKVLKVEGLNKDGKELLKDNKLNGNTLENAIEDITKKVIDKGYITENDNYILINVYGSSIEDKVITLINKQFKENNTKCNIIIQETNEESTKNAEKYGISESKASYIEDVIKEHNNMTFEDLKDKTINEIMEIIKDKDKQEDKKNDKNIEEDKSEDKKPDENKPQNTNTTTTKPSQPTTKPQVVYTPPASDDRTGAWCEFYKTIPPEGGVDYETPGYISDIATYVEASKKHMPEDANFSQYYGSITQYRTGSYCGAGIVEVENYEKTKTYTAYLDTVTLELLELTTTNIDAPTIDEAGALNLVTQWLSNTYGIDINTCGAQNFYYAVQYDALLNKKVPEWQFSCHIEDTKTFYAVVVNAMTGELTSGRTWTY